MLIKKINPQEVDKALAEIEPLQIDNCNWPKEFPYAPQVTCRLAHTGEYLIVKFEVAEQYTMALVKEDNGEVWTDSCVETFIALDNEGYYNCETTCIGKLLLAHRREREVDVEHAKEEVLQSIKRTPSLAVQNFEEVEGDNRWSLKLEIPATALFKHHLTSWDGVKARMNLYKCGDNLSHPHFLSWGKIENPTPDFHKPEFFQNVEFEA